MTAKKPAAPYAAANATTSAGVPWSAVSEDVRHHVEFIDGRHGPARAGLPSLDAVPVPEALLTLPGLHPDRPRGPTAMVDALGATGRLPGCRPGAWMVSPLTGHRWAVWPDGEGHWLPRDLDLPASLREEARNDVN